MKKIKKVVNVIIPVEVEITNEEYIEAVKINLSKTLGINLSNDDDLLRYIAANVATNQNDCIRYGVSGYIDGVGQISFNAKKLPIYDENGCVIEVNTKMNTNDITAEIKE